MLNDAGNFSACFSLRSILFVCFFFFSHSHHRYMRFQYKCSFGVLLNTWTNTIYMYATAITEASDRDKQTLNIWWKFSGCAVNCEFFVSNFLESSPCVAVRCHVCMCNASALKQNARTHSKQLIHFMCTSSFIFYWANPQWNELHWHCKHRVKPFSSKCEKWNRFFFHLRREAMK